jgi:RNA polymerase subunit RPABC4/transcription elongation factor Spt4
MIGCIKCGTEFEPQKGLKSYCSLKCRNSRKFSDEAIEKKSVKSKLAHRRGAYEFRKTSIIESDTLCEYGCNTKAKFRLGTKQTACCEDRYTKCPAVRYKNSKGLEKAYEKGTKVSNGFTKEKSDRGRNTFIQNLKQRPFEQWGRVLKRKLIFEEQEKACRKCKLKEWLGKPITLELEHIDGNRENNTRKNLELLCPNCHSQTSTYKSKNKKQKIISVEDKIEALKKHNGNINAALKSLKLTPGAGNWQTMSKLLETLD